MAVVASTAKAPMGFAEARPVMSSSHASRMVAVAIAAVARDLIQNERVVAASSAPSWDITLPEMSIDAVGTVDPGSLHRLLRPAERLLDLPPPTC